MANKNKIGVKIGLEGEKQFKNALYDINQSFKVLGSEMKLVDSEFDKNDKSVKALSARNQVLNKEIDAQKQKIETLRAALANSAKYFGENDNNTKKWQVQLNNAQAALNGMERELKENNDLLDQSDGKFDKFKGTLASIGKAAAAAAAAIGAAVAAAMVKLGKEVVEASSDYEQLVGGIETLFGVSGQSMQEYAASVGKSVKDVQSEFLKATTGQRIILNKASEAYKTAGLSANEYMETVTSFSASLIKSLGGDTKKAAEYADMAITDMSDNANKMGTNMELIQNAYQGFAKQNYTMLDNLKLGYGGTKEEMQRLLADAEKLSGKKYDLSSYADIVDAIHEIQTSMGITGTTAKEAERTISGSINTLQASLKNLTVGFGDANSDIEMLCQNTADAFKNVITNITPVIKNIVKALPTAATAILEAVRDLLPTLLKVVTNLFSQILDTVIKMLPTLFKEIGNAAGTIVQTLMASLPQILNAGIQIISTLIEGIAQALPALIPQMTEIVIQMIQGLLGNLPLLLDAALQLITGLAQGLIAAVPTLIEALPGIIQAVVDFVLSSIPQIIEAGTQLLTALVGALPDIISAIVEVLPQIIEGIVGSLAENVPLIVQAGLDLLTSLVQNLPQIIETIVLALPEIITAILGAISNSIPQLIDAGIKLFTSLIENLPTIIVEIVKAVPQIISAIVQAFIQSMPKIVEIGGNIVKGLWEGIQGLASWLWDKVSGWVSSIWDGICDFFGIHSPSTEMAWIGKMLTKGLAGGIEKNGNEAVNATMGMVKDINGAFDGLSADMAAALPENIDVNAALSGVNSSVSGQSGQAFNVTIPLAIDGTTLSRILAEIQWSQNAVYVRNLGAV